MTRSAPLRLHMNENTAGCAPDVLQAVGALTARDLAQYPDYAEAEAACARHFAVDPRGLFLTNGLDDGLHAAANRARTYGASRPGFEAIVIEPAFEMFALAAESADARVVRVTMDDGFAFPLARVLAALTPRTRLIFVNDPNNPTGLGVPRTAVEQIAEAAPEALVLLDEAYADFSGRTLIGPLLDRYRNLVIGRTFAKAYGLAGLRIGALIGHPDMIAAIRSRQPPYAVNAAAACALVAALEAKDATARTVAAARASKERIYDWCRSRGLTYWPSEANFVLVRFGPAVSAIVDAVAERGVLIRDRSVAPGCAGCARIAASVVEHTDACLAALDAALPAFAGARER
jgi:histidinol-phosphate aminotransferase